MELNKKEIIDDVVKKAIIEEVDEAVKKKNYKKHNSFYIKDLTYKIYPLSFEQNKRIAEINEDVNTYRERLEKEEDPENIKLIIDNIKDSIELYNNIISENVYNDITNSKVNISEIPIIDYQFINLKIFSVGNGKIPFRLSIENESEKNKYIEVDIPMTDEILDYIRNNKTQKIIWDKKDNFKVKYTYCLRSVSGLSGTNVDVNKIKNYSELEEIENNLIYKIGNFEFILKIPSAKTLSDSYINTFILSKKLKDNRDITNTFLDGLVDFAINNIAGAILKKGNKEIDLSQYIIKKDEDIIGGIRKLLTESDFSEFEKLVTRIFKNMVKLEVDVELYTEEKEEPVYKASWGDVGLSFFLR